MQKTIWDKYAEVLVDYSTDVQKVIWFKLEQQVFMRKTW